MDLGPERAVECNIYRKERALEGEVGHRRKKNE
jgi:hypothetical protein